MARVTQLKVIIELMKKVNIEFRLQAIYIHLLNLANLPYFSCLNSTCITPAHTASIGAYTSMATPSGFSSSAYPTPPSSVNQQQVSTQQPVPSQGSQDDSLRHFASNSTQKNGTTNFANSYNATSYSTPKLSTNAGGGNSSNSSVISNSSSSCMVAAAAAAAAASSSSSNQGVNFLHGSLPPTNLTDPAACLSSIVPSIPDDITSNSKINLPNITNNAPDNVNIMPPDSCLGAVFTDAGREFPSLNFNPVDFPNTVDYAALRLENSSTPRKKKDKSKKHKKKDKSKSLPVDEHPTFASNFSMQNSTPHYSDGFLNYLNPNPGAYLQSQSDQSQNQNLPNQVDQSMTPLAVSQVSVFFISLSTQPTLSNSLFLIPIPFIHLLDKPSSSNS